MQNGKTAREGKAEMNEILITFKFINMSVASYENSADLNSMYQTELVEELSNTEPAVIVVLPKARRPWRLPVALIIFLGIKLPGFNL